MVKRGTSSPELVLFCLAGVRNLLNSIFTHQPELLRVDDVLAALQGLFTVLSTAQSDSEKLPNVGQDRQVWLSFVSLFIVLHDYLRFSQDKAKLYESFAIATQNKPWLSKYLADEDVIRALFTDTTSKTPTVQQGALKQISLAMNSSSVTQSYLSKRLLSNLISRVLPQNLETKASILTIMKTAASHTEEIWTLDESKTERSRLKALLETELEPEIKMQVALLLKRA